MNDKMLIRYGARSTLARWAEQYWSENDRKALPWLCVILFSFALFYGPQFLLWLVTYLPADQLGNSGASIRAHQTIAATAALLALAVAAIILKWLARPRFIAIDDSGVKLVWALFFIKISGPSLPWTKITTINILQPQGTTDPALGLLQFGTEKKHGALQIPLGQIEGDRQRQSVAEAIGEYAKYFVDADVFAQLAAQKNLSFTELWLDALTAPPSREKLLPLTAGTLLQSRYQIVSQLGAGGQGTAYLALDMAKNKTKIVLKESILPVYANLASRKKALESFHKEALALEAVKHPGIVKFIDSLVVDHRAYLALEFLEGLTLDQEIKKKGPMPQTRAINLALQMCAILEQMHSLSPAIVHRDFTPDNLIIDADDHLTLIDFAVSIPGGGPDDSAEVAGKVAYMAPEQFQGKAVAQSDIYSMCATLHYLLTGETPEAFTQSNPILQNHQVEKRLSDIVAAGTEQSLQKRYKSIDQVRTALTGL